MELRSDPRVAIERAEAVPISSPSGHLFPNRLEPQTEQKAFTRPPSGR